MENVTSTPVTIQCVTDGHSTDNVRDCEALYVIYLYTKIARRRAENSNGILSRVSSSREERPAAERQVPRCQHRKQELC